MIPFIRRRRFAYSIHTHSGYRQSRTYHSLLILKHNGIFLNPPFYFFPIGNNTHYDGSGIHHHHHHTSTKIQQKKTKLHHFSTRDFRLAYFLIFFFSLSTGRMVITNTLHSHSQGRPVFLLYYIAVLF